MAPLRDTCPEGFPAPPLPSSTSAAPHVPRHIHAASGQAGCRCLRGGQRSIVTLLGPGSAQPSLHAGAGARAGRRGRARAACLQESRGLGTRASHAKHSCPLPVTLPCHIFKSKTSRTVESSSNTGDSTTSLWAPISKSVSGGLWYETLLPQDDLVTKRQNNQRLSFRSVVCTFWPEGPRPWGRRAR